MAGHLYRLPGEKGWRVQIDIGVDPGTGRRVRVKLPGRRKAPFPTKREAEHAAAQALLERAASGGVGPKPGTPPSASSCSRDGCLLAGPGD